MRCKTCGGSDHARATSKLCKKRKIESVDNAVMFESECKICLGSLYGKIWQCQNGHVICERCDEKIGNKPCPTCRNASIKSRNIALENIVKDINIACPYKDYGCKHECSMGDMQSHAVSCTLRECKCPINGCNVLLDTPMSLVEHINKSHSQVHTIKSDSVVRSYIVPVDQITEMLVWTPTIIEAQNRKFIAFFRKTFNNFMCSVYEIRDRKTESNYVCTIKIANRHNTALYQGKVRSYTEMADNEHNSHNPCHGLVISKELATEIGVHRNEQNDILIPVSLKITLA